MDKVPYIDYSERDKTPSHSQTHTPMPKILKSTKDGFTIEVIRERISTNATSTGKALIALYIRQTEDERIIRETTDDNGRGFNKGDALYLTQMGALALANQRAGSNSGGLIPGKELLKVRKRLMKYAKQLKDIYDGKR